MGVDDGTVARSFLRRSAGCFTGLSATTTAASFLVVRWWPDRTDMRRRNSNEINREASAKHGTRRT